MLAEQNTCVGAMKKVFEITVVSLIMAGLSLVSTFPLIKNFTKGIPCGAFRGDLSYTLMNYPGDQLQLFYFFWLVKQNLLGRVPLNANPYEFNMLGGQTAGNEGFTTAPLAFISFLFSPLGDIVAYNCTVISSYILAGVFMYLLARIITDSRTGALLAAVMFTFIPLRIIGVAGGQQVGFVLFLYPMIFYFMEKCIRTEKVRYSILAGIGIIALSFNEPHLIYYLTLCLAGYLPVRFLSLLPLNRTAVSLPSPFYLRKVMSWPPWLSLLVIWGGGVAVVLYAHYMIPRKVGEPILSPLFGYMIAYYPLIPLFFSIMMASIYSRLGDKIRQVHGLAIEAGSMLPFYLLLPMALMFQEQKPGATIVMVFAVSTIIPIKIWLLKPHFFGIVSHVWKHTKAMKKLLFVFLPALLGVVGTVLLTFIRKTNAIAPTTESGGRSLDDVQLYSAHLHDLVIPTSPVYTGPIAISCGAIFLCYLIYHAVGCNKVRNQSDVNLSVYGFVAVLLLLSQALAMGLSLGNRSLYILFYNYVPFFNVPRVSDRILCVTILLLACITAVVVNGLSHRFRAKSWKAACSIIFLALTVLQLKLYSVNVPMVITDLYPIEDGYQYIKENIGDDVLLELPLWPGDSHQSSLYEYMTTLDEVKRVNGYTPLVSREYIRTVFFPLYSMDMGTLTNNQYDLLRSLNVKYITVHEHSDVFPAKVSPYPPATTVRRLHNSPFLEYIGPWRIFNKKYNKVHEWLHIFRVREDVLVSESITYYTMPVIYRAGSRLPQQTGKISADSITGHDVYRAVPGRDKAGFLVYGPYEGYFPGKYRCYFRIKYRGNSDGLVGARIEAVRSSSGKQDILATTELTEGSPDLSYQDYYLEFEIDKWEQLEFRVFFYGSNEISLDKIVVTKRGDVEQPSFLEAEMMVGETGRIVSVAKASGQKVIEAQPGKDKPGRIVYGPDLQYAQGDYSAIFHFKRPDSQQVDGSLENTIAAKISITGYQGSTKFAKKSIPLSSLQSDVFSKIRLDFTLLEAEEIGFEVLFTNKASIQFDGVEVVKKD